MQMKVGVAWRLDLVRLKVAFDEGIVWPRLFLKYMWYVSSPLRNLKSLQNSQNRPYPAALLLLMFCRHISIYIREGCKSRYTVFIMKKTIILLSHKKDAIQIAIKYNHLSAQIAGLHHLHLLVVKFLHSSTLWHRGFYCYQFLGICGMLHTYFRTTLLVTGVNNLPVRKTTFCLFSNSLFLSEEKLKL
jgi:hypothetical protein